MDHEEPLSEYRDATTALVFETRTNLFVVVFVLGVTAGTFDFPEKAAPIVHIEPGVPPIRG
jgi:hypothetical protein